MLSKNRSGSIRARPNLTSYAGTGDRSTNGATLTCATLIYPVLLTVFLGTCITPAFAQKANLLQSCQSGDVPTRISGCTKVIKRKGFGSRSILGNAFDGRCSAYNTRRQFALAIEDCLEAIALNPRNFYVLNNLATAYIGTGAFEEALVHLNEAIRYKSSFYWSRLNRAKALKALGRNDEARADLNYLARKNSSDQSVQSMLSELDGSSAIRESGPGDGDLATPLVVNGRCHMGSCSFIEVLGIRELSRNDFGTLVEVRERSQVVEAPVINDDTRYELVRIPKFSGPTSTGYAFCSLKLPAVVFYNEEQQAFYVDVLSPSEPASIFGYNTSSYLYYWAICHNRRVTEAELGGEDLTRDAKVLGYHKLSDGTVGQFSFRTRNLLYEFFRLRSH